MVPFDDIVRRYATPVLRVCRALTRSAADAEDVWSETFLAALRAYPTLADDANVEAWLVTIAHRKAIDAGRAAARRATPTDALPERWDADDPPDVDVWDRVRLLPDRQRQAVAYRHFAGLAYREIAVLTDSSEAAVRRAAADGLRALRRHFTPATSEETTS